MTEPRWLTEARKHIGQKEIPGKAENSWIVSLWKAIKRGGIKTESVPWCAAFVGACLENVGIQSSRYESAKSYLTWGEQLSVPMLGCIVVFTRDGGGHVAFCVGKDDRGRLLCLGGNQSDAVTIAPFDRARVSAYRWPAGEYLPALATLPVLASNAPTSRNEA